LCQVALSQDAPAPREKPAREPASQPTTEGEEEARQRLLRRLEARKLIRRLRDGRKEDLIPELEKLGAEAVQELNASEDKEAADALKQLCKKWTTSLAAGDSGECDRAFRLLYGAGEAAVESLKEASGSDNAHLKEQALLLLHMIDYRVSPELYERLGHVMADFGKADWRKKIEMISELERLGGSLAVPALKRMLKRETNPRVQGQAANSLIRVGTLEDLKFLQRIGLTDKIQAPAITAEIYLSQGIKYRQAEKYNEAIEEFKKALKDAPDDFRAHYEIAMAYLLTKQYALSVGHFKECLKQQPDNYLAHYNLACSYSLMNDADAAVKHLALSIEKGYGDISHMENDEDLDNIRSDKRYKQLLQELRSRQEEPKQDEKQK
jgi:tetratricopeptide (TPR) repeat protein